jgi:CheY-like chemotaxis protein
MKTRSRNLSETSFQARIRTLIVDDSPRTLKVLAQTLKKLGNFDLVGTATDERQALPYVSALYPDLVLVDIHMPRLNGLQATYSIKHRDHPPVLIVVSSDDDSITRARAAQAGADGFITKAADLRQRLTAMLQGLYGPNKNQVTTATGRAFQNLHAVQE